MNNKFYKKQAEKRHLKRIEELRKRKENMQKEFIKLINETDAKIISHKNDLARIYFTRKDFENYKKYKF